MALEVKVVEAKSLNNEFLIQILEGGWRVNAPGLIVLSREIPDPGTNTSEQEQSLLAPASPTVAPPVPDKMDLW